MKYILGLLLFLYSTTGSCLESQLRQDIFKSPNLSFHFERWQQGAVVVPPPATWVLILEVALKANEKGCLFYRASFEKKFGELRYYQGSECGQNYDQAAIKLKEVEALSLNFKADQSRLTLEFSLQKKKTEWQFIYPSFKNEHQNDELLGDGTSEATLRYLTLGDAQTPQMKGSFSDNYRDGTAIICEAVRADCSRAENSCDSCAFGSFQVVDHHCPGGGSRYCGVNRCGEQGQPACPRGETAATRTLPAGEILSWCAKESTAGFCQQGLITNCDGKGVLVCL